ncbi:hypothetical protein CCH79_00018783 [Gambusia affinis]|uniref:Uncharacterized protein n=1 Tax=Gambusia affinis TaxID=33528 RepID=A0A315W923_GAMAF|nr:hypothetical protein CCH79_00018783 [Gambusia affinis]
MPKPYIKCAPSLTKAVSCFSNEQADSCVGTGADTREELSSAEPEGDIFFPDVSKGKFPNSEHGLAVASSSAWSSPCLLTIKANGEDHFCTDLRKSALPPFRSVHHHHHHRGCVLTRILLSFISKLKIPLNPFIQNDINTYYLVNGGLHKTYTVENNPSMLNYSLHDGEKGKSAAELFSQTLWKVRDDLKTLGCSGMLNKYDSYTVKFTGGGGAQPAQGFYLGWWWP